MTLTSGQPYSALAEMRVKAVGQAIEELGCGCRLRSGAHFCIIGVGSAIANVFGGIGRENDWILRHQPDARTKQRRIRLADIEAIRLQAPQDARIIVDATFATPLNVRVLELGADLAVHSATKYLGGHHDLIAGVVAGGDELMARVWLMRKLFGPVLDPAAAYRLWRGLETLSLRVTRQNETAATLAARLATHPRVERVHYPTLPSHPDHALATRVMNGCGGVLSFEVAGGAAGAAAVADATQHVARAASLGGVSTLITWPSGVTHMGLTESERAASGVAPGLLRVAVGVEPVDALWRDLEQALAAAP